MFSQNNLTTTDGKHINVLKPGVANVNAGPDFFNASIEIDGQLWAGNVEIHVKSSDWYVHGHEKDSSYDNVVLHVVWQHDVEVFRKDGSAVSTLILKDIVDSNILTNYHKLVLKKDKWINCEQSVASVDKYLVKDWLERLYIERLEQKVVPAEHMLSQTNNDWEAVLFKMLLQNFGLKANKEGFTSLANSIDFSILRKQHNDIQSIEALLFGMAGLLDNPVEGTYFGQLRLQFDYLKAKYSLQPHPVELQFFRMRPANFPTLRLAQLAALYQKHQHLFSELLDISDKKAYYKLFKVPVSDFWQDHYTFTSSSKKSAKKITNDFIDLLLINTVIPLKFVYYKVIDKEHVEPLLENMQMLDPEKNSIINKFESLGIKAENALESQSILQLKNEYCSYNRCLECSIGNLLLKKMQ